MTQLDLTGKRFGKLIAIKKEKSESSRTRWLCKCDCGKEKIVRTEYLVRCRTKSCGCSSIEMQMETKGHTGISKTRIYRIWLGMRKRCLNPKQKYYGSKGITVCKEWDSSFNNFYKWSMQNGYNDKLTIDRIDGDGNYEPSNCRWTDFTTQSRNRGMLSNNKTGCSGVYFYKNLNKYRATIGVNKDKISLGLFNTLKEAIDARKEAEKKYWAV
jgi:hypothetical protein